MTRQERIFVRLLTGFFYGVAGFVAIGLIFWFYPNAKIPEYIPKGSNCRIETTATYHIQILPLLNKNYTYIFNSNQFQIKE